MTLSVDAKQQSLRTWNRVAGAWERWQPDLWGVSRHVSEWLLSRLELRPGQTVLEIGAGPGLTGLEAARAVGPSGVLICTDFSPEMIEVARRRAQAEGVDNVEFAVMDAEDMHLPDDAADAVVCRFAYMLMHDQTAALAHTRRVLRPGGRLAFAVWGSAERNPWATVSMQAVRHLVPPTDPAEPGGMFSLGDPARIRELVGSAGFGQPEIAELDHTWRYASFEHMWDMRAEISGTFSDVLSRLSGAEVDEVKAKLEAAVEPYRTDDGYELPGLALAVAAR